MGSREFWYYDCPECGEKNGVEVYDHFSAMCYSESCRSCDFKVDLEYYEESENHFVLISTSEARDKGFLCHKCDNYLYIEEREGGLCEDCIKK